MPGNTKKLVLLITPSWWSGLTAVTITLLIIGTAYIRTSSSGGLVKDGVTGFQSLFVFSPIYHRLTDALAQNNLASNIPLLLFWSIVGAVVYLIAAWLFTVITKTAALEQTLFYENVSRHSFLESLAVSFGLRLLAVFVWLVYCALFFKSVLPATVAAGKMAAMSSLTSSLGPLLLAVVTLFVAIHLHVVFIRMILLRTRVFSDGLAE